MSIAAIRPGEDFIDDKLTELIDGHNSVLYGVVNVRTYGTTAAAINEAAAVAKDAGALLVGRGAFDIDETVTIACNADFSAATFTCDDNTLTALRIGTTTSGTKIDCLQVIAPRVIQTKTLGTGWTGSDVGIEIANLNDSFVRVPWIENFKKGLRVTGYSTGCSYNNIEIGFLRNNQIMQAWQPEGVGSWVNENTIIGGRHEYRSAEGTNITDARYILIDDSGDIVNGLVFLRPSLEGDGPEIHVEVRDGQQNLFVKPRCEVGDPVEGWKLLFTGSSCQRNELLSATSLNDIKVTEADGARRNSVYLPNGWLMNGGDLTRPSLRVQNGSDDGMLMAGMAYDATLAADATTGYRYGLFEEYLAFKATADTNPRLQIDHATGLMSWGAGSGAADGTFGRIDVGLIGSASHRIQGGNGFRVGSAAGSPTIRSGSGDPEGSVSADPGSLWLRTTGAVYKKASGTGNTGWTELT